MESPWNRWCSILLFLQAHLFSPSLRTVARSIFSTLYTTSDSLIVSFYTTHDLWWRSDCPWMLFLDVGKCSKHMYNERLAWSWIRSQKSHYTPLLLAFISFHKLCPSAQENFVRTYRYVLVVLKFVLSNRCIHFHSQYLFSSHFVSQNLLFATNALVCFNPIQLPVCTYSVIFLLDAFFPLCWCLAIISLIHCLRTFAPSTIVGGIVRTCVSTFWIRFTRLETIIVC